MKQFGTMIRRLREAQGLTQLDLAKRANVNQGWLSQIEAGQAKSPGIAVLRRLAKAMNVSVAELGQTPTRTARAMRLIIDPSKLFPLDDPLSVPLLRLMIAADDARHLQKLILRAPADVDADNKSEKAILEGELGHLSRILCGHLFEAGKVFRNRTFYCSALLDAAVADSTDGKAALQFVRKAYNPDDEQSFWYSFLMPLRQHVGFHYKEKELHDSFKKLTSTGPIESSLTLVQFTGLGRYTVTDTLVKLVIGDALGGDILQKYPKGMKEAIVLSGSLIAVVDLLLLHLAMQRPEARLDQHQEVITVPRWLRKQFAKTRTKGGDDGENYDM